jgi:hypothetical protein
MNKYMLMGMLLVLGLSFAQWCDPYIGYRYEGDYCRALAVQSIFDNLGYENPEECLAEGTYIQMETVLAQLFGDDGSSLLGQMSDTNIAACECYSRDSVDQACLARYRQQFRSQQSTFNSLMQTTWRTVIAGGVDNIRNECTTSQGFRGMYLQYYMYYAMCEGGGGKNS